MSSLACFAASSRVGTVLCACAMASLVLVPAKANSAGNQGFLGQYDDLPHGQVATDLLSELERVVGRDHRMATERRVARLEAALVPMYTAMPKDSAGNLHSTSVRYLLHRLFVQRHGWFVNGLRTVGDAWNSSSPAQVFEKHIGRDVHDVFHSQLSTTGFSLHQVAVFAATLEALAHTEAIERLEAAYRIMGKRPSEQLNEDQAAKSIDMYMMMYVRDLNYSLVTKAHMERVSESMVDMYPTWPDTQVFVQGVRESVLVDVGSNDRTSWNTTLRVLEEVGERYGRWQDKECHVLKDELVKMDEDGNGRVPLERFYEQALTNSSWQFRESVPYLRQVGALDETNPQRMSVMIPNYVNSPSNCVASSKYFSVCCIDECEALLGSLEAHIGMPNAPPSLIIQLVSGMKSTTVPAPRQLDASLVERLDEIATHHSGIVPLHGRLFSQFMHHAYPRECPFPHQSGTTSPVAAEEFYAITGQAVEATHHEMSEIMDQCSHLKDNESSAEAPLPWHPEEELFVHRPARSESVLSLACRVVVRCIMMAGASASMVVMLMRSSKAGAKGLIAGDTKDHKYFV